LDNVLGIPPLPPPADIPALPSGRQDGRTLSMQQRMEIHRRNPACASCHRQMDPLGFALEEFDAIGRSRSVGIDVEPIDPTGVWPDGTRVRGLAGLRALLTGTPEDFVRVVTERLLTYALGRTVESSDMPTIRSIVKEAARDNYRWSSVVLKIAES